MRSEKIDFLRFIGLSMIILAHVEPPEVLFELRNFDVPLMVLVSGMSFAISFREESYVQYIWKRIKRLVLPVWIFLTIFFLGLLIFKPSSQSLGLDRVLGSYLLIEGIGYIWIIRIFLLVAIVSPLLFFFHKRIKKDFLYFFLIAFCFLIFEFVRARYLPYLNGVAGKVIVLVFFYAIPYALVFAIGLRVPVITIGYNYFLLTVFGVVYILFNYFLFINNQRFVSTQEYKYPPSIYYLSYALFISIALWITSDKFCNILSGNAVIKSIVFFVAQNSIWIYLWHIPIVMGVHAYFVIKYIFVFSIAVLITFMQVWFVNNVLLVKVKNISFKKNIKLLLIG